MPAWEVRVVLTRLAGDAWEHVCALKDFVTLFQETGCLIPKLGANTVGIASIKIAGVTNFSFELEPRLILACPQRPRHRRSLRWTTSLLFLKTKARKSSPLMLRHRHRGSRRV